jgi:hypothetical protein
MLIYPAGIGHRIIKEQFKKIVAKVIVRLDVPFAARYGIAPQLMKKEMHEAKRLKEMHPSFIERMPVVEKKLKGSAQVRGVPVSLDKALTQSKAPIENQASKEPKIADLEPSHGTGRRITIHLARAVRHDELKRSLAHPP